MSAAPSYPSPESSARKSPRAVPSVFEKRIVAQLHCHRKCISTRLAQRSRGHLYDPKGQGDFGNFARTDFVKPVPVAGPLSKPLARYWISFWTTVAWLAFGARHRCALLNNEHSVLAACILISAPAMQRIRRQGLEL